MTFNIFQYISEWMWADQMLYDYFKSSFLRDRESYGIDKISQEKEILEYANDRVKQMCIEKQVDNDLLPNKDGLPGTDFIAYKPKENVSESLCSYYKMREFRIIDDVRSIQEKKSLEVIETRSCP